MKKAGRKRNRKMKETQASIPDPVMEDLSLASPEVLDDNSPEGRKRGRARKNSSIGAQGSPIGHSMELIVREPVPPEIENKTSDRVLVSPIRMVARVVEDNNGVELSRVALGNVGEVKKESVIKVVPSMDAVVKVFCVHTDPNFSLPWQRKRQYSSSSSGFIIGGRRVLTNAHSVEHYTQVKLKKRGSDTKYLATVLAIGTECDIAMLTVDDDEFWDGVSPVEFGCLPSLQDAVTVVGYPIGGTRFP